MHVQIHAKRFGATEEERDKQFFNHAPAAIDIQPQDDVVIHVVPSEGVVCTWINGKEQMPVALGEYDYTAYAICFGSASNIKDPGPGTAG